MSLREGRSGRRSESKDALCPLTANYESKFEPFVHSHLVHPLHSAQLRSTLVSQRQSVPQDIQKRNARLWHTMHARSNLAVFGEFNSLAHSIILSLEHFLQS
jgi:hypothetical protein